MNITLDIIVRQMMSYLRNCIYDEMKKIFFWLLVRCRAEKRRDNTMIYHHLSVLIENISSLFFFFSVVGEVEWRFVRKTFLVFINGVTEKLSLSQCVRLMPGRMYTNFYFIGTNCLCQHFYYFSVSLS